MAKYAVIENGLTVDVIEWDGKVALVLKIGQTVQLLTRYAMIESGKTVNVIEWDGEAKYDPGVGRTLELIVTPIYNADGTVKTALDSKHSYTNENADGALTAAKLLQRKKDAATALNNLSVLGDKAQRDAFARLIGVKPLVISAVQSATEGDIQFA